MAFEITIPRLGWSMEEGTFVRWLKRDGQMVRAGEAVFELEGEKAAQDIEAVDSGILRIPPNAPQPGTVVAVGAIIGYLVAENETTPISSASPQKSPTPVPVIAASPMPAKPPAAGRVSVSATSPGEPPAAPPSVRRMARQMGVRLDSVEGSGPAGRILAIDLQTRSVTSPTHPGSPTATVSTPRARRIATELGIDWRRLNGTGRNGRVREQDVRQAATTPGNTAGGSNVVPVSSRRKTIANRMLASCQQTAPVTLTTRIDATNLVSLRTQFKQSGADSVVPSYSDLILKLVTIVLKQFPYLAARSEGDQWVAPAGPADVNIGFAVDTDDGLVVPVVHGAGELGVLEIAERTVALIEKSRSGKLSVAEMQGGVFTLTNLGSFGIDAFTPIINLPETAVLGLGRIRREPVVVDDQIVARDQMTLSLTFDHRIVDGAPAARFLQTLTQAIENPSAWLLRGEQ